MDAQVISNLIALCALLVAVGSLIITLKSINSSNRLSEREIQLVRFQLDKAKQEIDEDKRARVSARLYKVDKSNWKLKVFNAGPSEARNVRIELTEENKIVHQGAISEKFPMAKLEKGQSVEVWASVYQGSPSKESVLLKWDDFSGIDNDNRVEITI